MSAGFHLSAQCRICGTLLSGPVSVAFRTFGIKRSSRNPNLCNRCGTHVQEGRVVEMTVLFADLSSFTELTHELGPEKTHEVVDAFLKMATDVLVHHGAFIDKYVGDAVMALFNVPIGNSDHSRQAVAAAIALRTELQHLASQLQLPLQASVGIATGWARVGRLGSEDNKDYTAIGDVVNLAARLQGKASAGEILIGEETFSDLRPHFPEAQPETLALKGFRDPVTAYRLHANRSAKPTLESAESTVKEKISLGAVVFGILGAPCAVTTLLSPLAVAVGAAGLFGLSAALAFFDESVIRVPILVLTALAAVANLYTVLYARKLRLEDKTPAHLKAMTALERRRAVFIVTASVLTLGIVAFEVIAHIVLHG